MKKKELEIKLQTLERRTSPEVKFEQYSTPPDIAADLLFFAYSSGDIASKKVLDAGCGNGIFAIGAKLLGAAEVVGLDLDGSAVALARKNASRAGVNISFLVGDIRYFTGGFDTVLQNPPFGSQKRHADIPFLETGLRIAPVVYSFHNAATLLFLKRKVQALGGVITDVLSYSFPIPHTFEFHRKDVKRFEVVALRIARSGQSVKS